MAALQGKVAIVTGASSGIGRAAALAFAKAGARLVLSARREAELDTLAEDIEKAGGEALSMAGDIREDGLAEALVSLAEQRFGGLHVAFNNVGATGPVVPFQDIAVEAWREVLEVNLTSAFVCAQRQAPAMTRCGGGSLIFTSTFVGHTVGFPGMAAYAAAKAGLVGLVQVIAAELGPLGVRANALLPGGTDTPMGRTVANTPEARAFVESLHALKRLAEPEEIAQAALFLASPASSFVTGSAMLVDGGVSITRT